VRCVAKRADKLRELADRRAEIGHLPGMSRFFFQVTHDLGADEKYTR
jgi:hypothetical protein